MVTPAQIKAARALVGLNQMELAELADIAASTLKRIELSTEITGAGQTLWRIQSALEKAGVEFIPADGKAGPGVRLKDDAPPKPRGRRGKAK